MMMVFALAMAQDLPETTCSDVDSFCRIHSERLATLFGKAKAAEHLQKQLIDASNKIGRLGDELNSCNLRSQEDGTQLLAVQEELRVSDLNLKRVRRQRNTAYIIIGGVAAAAIGTAYAIGRF